MWDEISLGPAPSDEDCAQLGSEDYSYRSRKEAIQYIELIRKKLGPEPEGARLRIAQCPHDFGTYLDVVVRYETDDQEAIDYAFRCEAEAPRRW